LLTRPVSIECTKEGVKFSCQGDIGSGSVQLRQHSNVENPKDNVEIDLSEPVSLTFSLKYLVNFCKASGLSDSVKLSLSSEVPLLVEYGLSGGQGSYLRFYLAPKVSLHSVDKIIILLTSLDRRRGVICCNSMFSGFMRDTGGALSRLHTAILRARCKSWRMGDSRRSQGFGGAPPIAPRASPRVEIQIRNTPVTTTFLQSHCSLFSPFLQIEVQIHSHGFRRARTRNTRACHREPCKSHTRAALRF
jgi:hypothetical protein